MTSPAALWRRWRSKSRTAVICAYNPKNTGMYTVDLSALSFFRDTRFRMFQVERMPRFGKIRYRQLTGDAALRNFDNIVFWGDFQNNPVWGAHDFAQRRMDKGASPDLDSARREWVSLYLRTREAVGPDKTILSVGTCFLGADHEDLLKIYGRDLRYLTDSFDLIAPRDPWSTEIVRRLGGSRETIIEGVDPVFLGDQLPARGRTARGRFGYFFHRSRISGMEHLVAAVAAQSGLEPICVPWFFLKNDRSTHRRYRAIIRQLLGCEFVVTDVYHMAATCLKMRMPVLGLGRSEPRQTTTLSDFKKKALFASVHTGNNYFELQGDALTPAFLAEVLEGCARVRSAGGLEPAATRFLDERPPLIKARIKSTLYP